MTITLLMVIKGSTMKERLEVLPLSSMQRSLDNAKDEGQTTININDKNDVTTQAPATTCLLA